MIDLRLCACAVAFQVGHEEVFFIANLKKDEGVGREKARGVVHVGVGFAGGNHEPRFGGVHYKGPYAEIFMDKKKRLPSRMTENAAFFPFFEFGYGSLKVVYCFYVFLIGDLTHGIDDVAFAKAGVARFARDVGDDYASDVFGEGVFFDCLRGDVADGEADF